MTSSRQHRQLYMVLSPRSLSYAQAALESLFRNTVDPINLHLVTDSSSDAAVLSDAVSTLQPDARHRWTVSAEEELNDAEATLFAGLPNLRTFRHGHPSGLALSGPP